MINSASFTGVLRSLADGYHVMRLDEPSRENAGDPAEAPAGLVALAFDLTKLRARAVALIGARVRVRGSLEPEAVTVDGPRGARVLASALLHVEALEDLDVRPEQFGGERRPAPPQGWRESAPPPARPPPSRAPDPRRSRPSSYRGSPRG